MRPDPGPFPSRTLAVVGAGFSGTLTAVRILRAAVGGGWRVILLERRSRLASIILEPTLPYFDS